MSRVVQMMRTPIIVFTWMWGLVMALLGAREVYRFMAIYRDTFWGDALEMTVYIAISLLFIAFQNKLDSWSDKGDTKR